MTPGGSITSTTSNTTTTTTISDARRLDYILRKFISLCRHLFFSHLDHSYGDVLNNLKLHTLMLGSVLGLRLPNLNFRDFNLFNVGFERRKWPSACCTSAANAIYSDADIFSEHSVSVNTRNWNLTLLGHNFINCLNL